MQFQPEAEDDEDGEKKEGNPGHETRCKVVVTRENGLQASEPTR